MICAMTALARSRWAEAGRLLALRVSIAFVSVSLAYCSMLSQNCIGRTRMGCPTASITGDPEKWWKTNWNRSWNVSGFTVDDATWYTCIPGAANCVCFATAASVTLTTMSAGT